MSLYEDSVRKITESFSKTKMKELNSIKAFDAPQLAEGGTNDTEGYQVFTPEFIVHDMCQAVGDDIFNPEKNVLEPTSGDGAFTTYILRERLKRIPSDVSFAEMSLKCLSTIYSIEMDKDLIFKQRNNIYTVLVNEAKERKLTLDDSYFEMAKCIILTNFMWAMFNSNNESGGLFFEVAYKMPEASKGNEKPLRMPVWKINKDSAMLDYEEVNPYES